MTWKEQPDNEPLKFTPQIDRLVFQLTYEEGEDLRDLIREHYPHAFPRYCTKVGIKTPNFYNAVNGERPCTLDWLNKLLSGIGYEAVISNPEIVIQKMKTGQPVQSADSVVHEIELLLNEQDIQEQADPYEEYD
jgi:hypothetical protein